MSCGAQNPTYKKVFCERPVRCAYGIKHTGYLMSPSRKKYWIEWDDNTTRRVGFWEMIQRLTERAKLRQGQEDRERWRTKSQTARYFSF